MKNGNKLIIVNIHMSAYDKGGVIREKQLQELNGYLKTAKENNCDIALFGHTHIPKTVYEDGIHLVNPGSCSRAREGGPTYAVIDITDKGIMPIIIEIV